MAPTTETKCQYQQLGQSGLRVSVPILGCLSFGDPGFLPWALPEDKVSGWRGKQPMETRAMGAD